MQVQTKAQIAAIHRDYEEQFAEGAKTSGLELVSEHTQPILFREGENSRVLYLLDTFRWRVSV